MRDDRRMWMDGRWVRRGREIILLPAAGAPTGEMEEEAGGVSGVIHPAIDVHAQYALSRMLKAGRDAGTEAQAMLQAVRTGTLAGIYKVDQQVPALRARAMGIGWWQLIPAGQGATVVPDPAGQGAPLITFASGLASRLPELERVLRESWARLLRGALGPTRRLRLSVWASHHFATPANLQGAKGLLDDVSLLRTMTFNPDRDGLTLMLDPLGAPSEAAYRAIAAQCQGVGVQALAGFAIVPEGAHKAREERIGRRFNEWLRTTDKGTPAFAVPARAMADMAQRCGFDGISVDVESLACDVGPHFTAFCATLAGELEKRRMWLAVAVTPKVDGQTSLPCFSRALEFGMGHVPNLVIRPMGYSTTGPVGERRHGAILDHALVTHRVRPSHVQLGLHNVQTETGGLSRGEIFQRCSGLLRPRDVGLVIFYLRRSERWDDWKVYDLGLNGGTLVPGPRPPSVGEPLQAPLNAAALERLSTSGTGVASTRGMRPRPLIARR